MMEMVFVVFVLVPLAILFFYKGVKWGHGFRFYAVSEVNRSKEGEKIPLSGGVSLYVCCLATLITIAGIPGASIPVDVKVLFGILSLMFLMGLIDDLRNLRAKIKLAIQFLLVYLLMSFTRVASLELTGIATVDLVLTLIASVFIINTINLIDGIDGLAGSIGLLISIYLSIQYLILDNYLYVFVLSTFSFFLIIFLFFNRYPAQLYLGDSGSLLIGTLLVFFALKLTGTSSESYLSVSGSAFLVNIFFIPVLDGLRVVYIRLAKGKNPMRADTLHIHHRLLSYGMSPVLVVVCLCIIQVLVLITGFLFPQSLIVIIVLTVAMLFLIESKKTWDYLLNGRRAF